MDKPRIEDMTDKHEVLNPDGSFRCYGSKTFDKLRKEWSKEKETYDNRDYFDCNVRLTITIDMEAPPELKHILFSKGAKDFVAQCYLGSIVNGPDFQSWSEAEVLRNISVEQIDGSEFEKYNY